MAEKHKRIGLVGTEPNGYKKVVEEEEEARHVDNAGEVGGLPSL